MRKSPVANNEQGVTTVETAMTLFPFMLIILGLMQITVFSFNLASLQYSLNKAARWGLLGKVEAGLTREESIEKHFKDHASNLAVDAEGLDIKICPATNPSCGTNSAGGAGQFVVITATKNVELFFGATYPMSTRVLIKNEPF